jgi:hypothetical protein
VADRLRQVAVHDFDEVGVPEHPDGRRRQRTTEMWVRRALEYQRDGIDLLPAGQSPLGEVLTAPSAPLLDGIGVCLVDVADEARCERLARRDGARWAPCAAEAFLGWAAWHRGHARDPHHRPDVIVDGSWPSMEWRRWPEWTAGDPRWRTPLLDTTGQTVAASVNRVEQWIAEQREARRAGRLALSRDWVDETSVLKS